MSALAVYFSVGPSQLPAVAKETERRVDHAIVSPGSHSNARERQAPNEDAGMNQEAESVPLRKRVGGEGAGWRSINWVRSTTAGLGGIAHR